MPVVSAELLSVFLKSAIVIDSEIGNQGLGALIGMNIISQGDFALTNFGGKTTFTFRHPSKRKIDFVQELRIEKAIGPKHGKQKRKRNSKGPPNYRRPFTLVQKCSII